jgi:hypothetical protein
MRRPRLDSIKSLSWGSSLLALLPLASPAEQSRQAPTCAVAIELQIKAPLPWGSHEWRLMTGEVEKIWTPYGLTVCWATPSNPCAASEVRLRVLVADDLPMTGAAAIRHQPVVGRIFFVSDGPTTNIALSLTAARNLVGEARMGDAELKAWPPDNWNALVPRVLGRALAHEATCGPA